MTILPTGPATASSPLSPDTGSSPGDFMAAIEQALAAALGMPAMTPVAPVAAATPQPAVVATPAAAPGFEAPASAVAPQPAVMGSVATQPAQVVEPVETPTNKVAPGFEAPASAVAPQPPAVRSCLPKVVADLPKVVADPAPVVEPVETPTATVAPGFEAPASAVAPQPPVVVGGTSPTPLPTPVVELAETPTARTPKPTTAPGFEAPASAVAPQPAVVAKATTHEQADPGPNDQPAQQPPAPAPSTLPLTSAVPLTATTPSTAGTSPTHTPAAVVRAQVFGEVTSLVSRGPGTHRITLTLHPETLGEVRVVMTVRDGAVHVRLAAGAEAHQALLDGSGELGHLLERAGATESRVVVRELTPAAPATSADSGQLNLGTGDRPTDQHAGTRADHPATDGADRLLTRHPPVPQEARPTQPVNRARTSGLDLTM